MWRDHENGKEVQVHTRMSVKDLVGKVMYFGKCGATRFERPQGFRTLPLVSLSGFNSDKVDEFHGQIHALPGYVDAKLALQFVS